MIRRSSHLHWVEEHADDATTGVATPPCIVMQGIATRDRPTSFVENGRVGVVCKIPWSRCFARPTDTHP